MVCKAFKRFDINNNGTIDAKELQLVLGDDTAEAMLKSRNKGKKRESHFLQIDLDKDGVIDSEEFFAMIRNESGIAPSSETDAIRKQLKDKEDIRLQGIVEEEFSMC